MSSIVAKSMQVNAKSIRQPYRCDRINKIYPQMHLHLGVKFYRVLRLSAVKYTQKIMNDRSALTKSTAVTCDGNV